MIAFLMKTEEGKWKVIRFRKPMQEFAPGMWGFTWFDLAKDLDLMLQVSQCRPVFTFHVNLDALIWVPSEKRQSSVAS